MFNAICLDNAKNIKDEEAFATVASAVNSYLTDSPTCQDQGDKALFNEFVEVTLNFRYFLLLNSYAF